MKALFIPLLFFWFCSTAQSVLTMDGTACNMHGSARVGSDVYYLNELKNRYIFPQNSDFDKSITFQGLMQSADPNQFSPTKAARLQGYVYNVKAGGVESCNCKAKNLLYRDTHIELTPDETKTDPQYRVIVEVTPRLRALMAQKGIDWSTAGLRNTLKGHYVTITGWLLYDAEHESGAFANDPNNAIGAQNWRASCWEIHPITAIEPASGGTTISINPTHNKKKPAAPTQEQEPQGNPNFKYFLIGLVVVIVLLLFLLTQYRK